MQALAGGVHGCDGVEPPPLLGSCSSIEGKSGQLVAYLVQHDPDVVCLQELWVDLDPARIVGLTYRLFLGDTFQDSGVVMMMHFQREGRAKVQVWKEKHALGVCVRPETPEAVAVISAHFPPKMALEEYARMCKEVAGFLVRCGAIFKFLKGNLNAAGRAGGVPSLWVVEGLSRLVCAPTPPRVLDEHCASTVGAFVP